MLVRGEKGTAKSTVVRALAAGAPVAVAQRELPQIYPQPGWVEQDAEEVWTATRLAMAAALALPGVRQVVQLSNGGVAVAADHMWAALQG